AFNAHADPVKREPIELTRFHHGPDLRVRDFHPDDPATWNENRVVVPRNEALDDIAAGFLLVVVQVDLVDKTLPHELVRHLLDGLASHEVSLAVREAGSIHLTENKLLFVVGLLDRDAMHVVGDTRRKEGPGSKCLHLS